ncbi:tetratricopeptide repeat protein [Aegicerativicinus sediminis]|uniref:tetratricopeptide repeat protein n=1 Tax=Aegicerativicinus sediminis TaxID=2893202 RepID=UPI001E2E766E|nr:tetratricopeptide repeat protein [Aegicerativicinus sediminis]
MRGILSWILVFSFFWVSAQEEQLADEYFKNGEFEKAQLAYLKLFENEPANNSYFSKLLDSYRQLEKFEDANALVNSRLARTKNPSYYVELGYNYQLMDSTAKAELNYKEAIERTRENPIFSYMVGNKFHDYSLLDEALEVYQLAMENSEKVNLNIQIARIYGEKGEVDKMFDGYLNYTADKPEFTSNAKRIFTDFVSENSENENNLMLKRLLLKRIQESPEIYWYDLLSWLFVQERDFKKSFIQEKALYRRSPESLSRLMGLGITAMEEDDIETSKDIFTFITENTQDLQQKLVSHEYLLDLKIKEAKSDADLAAIKQEYERLFSEFGRFEQTLSLQVSYAYFLAFHLKDPKAGSDYLKKSLNLPLSQFQQATVKMQLADILVFQEKFNEALIFYTQIQANLKNSSVSQEARFKVAKTSYYKGDFDWAESQLKILKASTSQLIANDALDLKLLISDNKYEDSLRTSLKLYAKADLFAFQNRKDEAISLLDKILEEHKGESITDQALYKQGKLYEEKGLYDKAIANYEQIISDYGEDILVDDAFFRLGEIYSSKLMDPEKAKGFFEKIIFHHEDSIYFVEARKKYRMLRGDAIN